MKAKGDCSATSWGERRVCKSRGGEERGGEGRIEEEILMGALRTIELRRRWGRKGRTI